jgi:tetratricopeptide (TPR) repeat protein
MPPELEPEQAEELEADLVEEIGESASGDVLVEALAHAADAAKGRYAHRRAAYEAELVATVPEQRRRLALLHYEIGELLESSQGDEAAAVKAYAQALQADPLLRPNLWAIRRIFERRNLWPNLRKLLDAEIRFATSPVEKSELLVEKAVLLEDHFNDPVTARCAYEEATCLHPGELRAWMALERLATSEPGDGSTRIGIAKGLIAATLEPGRRVALCLELATWYARQGAFDEAVAICRDALEIEEGGAVERVLDEWERIVSTAGAPELLLEVLERRAKREERRLAELSETERLRALESAALVSIRRRQAELAMTMGERQRALDDLELARRIAPVELLLLDEASAVAESLGRFETLAALLKVRREVAPSWEEPLLLMLQADAERRAGRLAEAEACEAELGQKVPVHLGLLIRRQYEAERAGDWERLVAHCHEEASLALAEGKDGAAEPMWAVHALERAAHLLSERLECESDAIHLLLTALEIVPGAPTATSELGRLYERAGRFAELAALIESELARISPTESLKIERLLSQLVFVRGRRLNDPLGAALACRRLVECAPEQLYARLLLIEFERAAYRFDAAAAELEKLAEMVDLGRRLDLLVERAELLEKIGNQDGAVAAYRRVLTLQPGEPRAKRMFEALSFRKSTPGVERSSLATWDELAIALRREAEASPSPEKAVVALLKLADIEESARGDLRLAADAYRDVLQKSPRHAAALRGLARVASVLKEENIFTEALERESELLEEREVRAGALIVLGEHYEDVLGDHHRAADAYARSADAAPNAHACLARLRVALRNKNSSEIDLLLEDAESYFDEGSSAAVRAALREERASVLRSVDPARAAVLFDSLFSGTEMPSRTLLFAKAFVHTDGTASTTVGGALEALAAESNDVAVRGALLRRAGLQGLWGGDRAAAIRRLREVRRLLVNDSAATVALSDLESDADLLLERAALARIGSPARSEWLLEAAEALCAEGQLPQAKRAVDEVLKSRPEHLAALELSRQILNAGGDRLGFAHATVRFASQVWDDERAARVLTEAGEIFERLGKKVEAAVAYRMALDRLPHCEEASARARALLVERAERGDAGPLLELYFHELEHARDDRARVMLLVLRAQLYEREGDFESAERDLRSVLEIEPCEQDSLLRLAALRARDVDGSAEAESLYRRYLHEVKEGEARREALVQLAKLLARWAPKEAVARYEEAQQISTTADVQEELADLLERECEWQRAVEAYGRLFELARDTENGVHAQLRISEIYLDELSDPRAAVEAARRAFSLNPLSLPVLERLQALSMGGYLTALEAEGYSHDAAQLARKRIRETPPEAYPIEVLGRLANWRRDEDSRAILQQALCLLVPGECVEAELIDLEPMGELSQAGWRQLWSEGARNGLEIWRIVSEAATRLYAPSLESMGVSHRSAGKELSSGSQSIDRILRAFGATPYELYFSDVEGTCSSRANALICGRDFKGAMSSRQRFRLAREAVLLRERLAPLEKMDDGELKLFFLACARISEVSFPAGWPPLGGRETEIEERTKALHKALGRKERKALVALGPHFSLLESPTEWRKDIFRAVACAGLCLSGDLAATLSDLKTDLSAPIGRDLLDFAASEAYAFIRHELGLRR